MMQWTTRNATGQWFGMHLSCGLCVLQCSCTPSYQSQGGLCKTTGIQVLLFAYAVCLCPCIHTLHRREKQEHQGRGKVVNRILSKLASPGTGDVWMQGPRQPSWAYEST